MGFPPASFATRGSEHFADYVLKTADIMLRSPRIKQQKQRDNIIPDKEGEVMMYSNAEIKRNRSNESIKYSSAFRSKIALPLFRAKAGPCFTLYNQVEGDPDETARKDMRKREKQ